MLNTPEVQRAQNYLAETQNSDGGWAYLAGGASVTESTAVALLTGPSADVKEKGVAWLLATQKEDGGWGMNPDDGEPGWLTAWAVWALLIDAAEGSLPAARRGVDWLLDVPVTRSDKPESLETDLLGVDPLLSGWAWQPGWGSWVEPTALSVLVLLVAGITDHPRVLEGVAFLRDRVCIGGGWNVGAPFNFGKQMSPTPHCTAVSLLALRAAVADRDEPVVAESLTAMQRMLADDLASASLAWGAIALTSWQTDDSAARDRVLERQTVDGDWENSLYATAAALLALQGLEMNLSLAI